MHSGSCCSWVSRSAFHSSFQKKIHGCILVYTVSGEFAFTGKFIIRTYPPNLRSSACTVITNCEVCTFNFGSFQTDLRTIT